MPFSLEIQSYGGDLEKECCFLLGMHSEPLSSGVRGERMLHFT